MAGIDTVGRGISQADAKNGGTKICSLLSRAGVERPPESRAARPVPPFDKKGASGAEQGVLLDRVSTARVAREAKERLALVRSLVRFLTRRINMGAITADAALEVNSGHSRSGH